MLFDGRHGNPELARDFFVGPTFCETLDDALLPIRELKPLRRLLIRVPVLAAQLLHDDNHARLFLPLVSRHPEAVNHQRSFGGPQHAPDLKLLPVLRLRSIFEMSKDFGTELQERSGKQAFRCF